MERLTTQGGETAHLHPTEAPVLKISGVLHRVEGRSLEPGDTELFLQSIASDDVLQDFRTSGMVRFEYPFGATAVFEVMAFRQDGHVHLVIQRSR